MNDSAGNPYATLLGSGKYGDITADIGEVIMNAISDGKQILILPASGTFPVKTQIHITQNVNNQQIFLGAMQIPRASGLSAGPILENQMTNGDAVLRLEGTSSGNCSGHGFANFSIKGTGDATIGDNGIELIVNGNNVNDIQFDNIAVRGAGNHGWYSDNPGGGNVFSISLDNVFANICEGSGFYLLASGQFSFGHVEGNGNTGYGFYSELSNLTFRSCDVESNQDAGAYLDVDKGWGGHIHAEANGAEGVYLSTYNFDIAQIHTLNNQNQGIHFHYAKKCRVGYILTSNNNQSNGGYSEIDFTGINNNITVNWWTSGATVSWAATQQYLEDCDLPGLDCFIGQNLVGENNSITLTGGYNQKPKIEIVPEGTSPKILTVDNYVLDGSDYAGFDVNVYNPDGTVDTVGITANIYVSPITNV